MSIRREKQHVTDKKLDADFDFSEYISYFKEDSDIYDKIVNGTLNEVVALFNNLKSRGSPYEYATYVRFMFYVAAWTDPFEMFLYEVLLNAKIDISASMQFCRVMTKPQTHIKIDEENGMSITTDDKIRMIFSDSIDYFASYVHTDKQELCGMIAHMNGYNCNPLIRDKCDYIKVLLYSSEFTEVDLIEYLKTVDIRTIHKNTLLDYVSYCMTPKKLDCYLSQFPENYFDDSIYKEVIMIRDVNVVKHFFTNYMSRFPLNSNAIHGIQDRLRLSFIRKDVKNFLLTVNSRLKDPGNFLVFDNIRKGNFAKANNCRESKRLQSEKLNTLIPKRLDYMQSINVLEKIFNSKHGTTLIDHYYNEAKQFFYVNVYILYTLNKMKIIGSKQYPKIQINESNEEEYEKVLRLFYGFNCRHKYFDLIYAPISVDYYKRLELEGGEKLVRSLYCAEYPKIEITKDDFNKKTIQHFLDYDVQL